MVWIVTMKLSPVRIDEKPVMKIPITVSSNVGVRIDAAVRRVKRPAGIDPAGGRGREGKQAAENINIPTGQVKARESEVARADHQGDQKISQDRRDRRDQEKENHRDAVHGE